MGVISINGMSADFAADHKSGYFDNSVYEILNREGFRLCVHGANIIAAAGGAHVLNVFKVTGAVRILEQYAIVTDVTDVANITNVYSTLYDGTNTVNLTADGITLSGMANGSFFTKDQDSTKTYTLLNADQCRTSETVTTKHVGYPFIVNAKYGANTYIRFHYTTAGTCNFTMDIHFIYQKLNGGDLTIV
jgi:hypothetical protein